MYLNQNSADHKYISHGSGEHSRRTSDFIFMSISCVRAEAVPAELVVALGASHVRTTAILDDPHRTARTRLGRSKHFEVEPETNTDDRRRFNGVTEPRASANPLERVIPLCLALLTLELVKALNC